MAEEEFKYDPEAEDNAKMVRLPFGLCKKYDIEIQKWWKPSNAWDALRGAGYIKNVKDEYKKYIQELKKKSAKISAQRVKRKKAQLASEEHTPLKDYQHQKGKIADAEKGKPMTFEEADSGKVNPNFSSFGLIGYRHNCQTCVAVYVARRKGYNVKALPNLNNKNIYALSYATNLAFVDKNGKHPEYMIKPPLKKTNQWMQGAFEEGKIYSCQFIYSHRRSGHIITVEKINGKIQFYDPQSNQKFEKLSRYGSISDIKYMNLSDCELDEGFCDKIMKKY